jgi:hypothetical protein
MSNSAAENGKRGTTRVLSGINNRMMMGNPTAAIRNTKTAQNKQNKNAVHQFGYGSNVVSF